jgi:hypothetical protein
MQFRIHFIRRKDFRRVGHIGSPPRFVENVIPFPPTFSTRSVACGKRNGFIQEEQLGVTARRHHGTAPTSEFQETSDPTPTGILPDNLAILIVKRSAPIAH